MIRLTIRMPCASPVKSSVMRIMGQPTVAAELEALRNRAAECREAVEHMDEVSGGRMKVWC